MSRNRFPGDVVDAYDRWQESATADDFALFIRALSVHREAIGRGIRTGDVGEVLRERFPSAVGTKSLEAVLASDFPTRADAAEDASDPVMVVDPALVNERHQPMVAAALEGMGDDSADPAATSAVGNAYFDWAAELEDAGYSSEATPLWLLAVEYYDRSLEVWPDSAPVLGDRAFALYWAESPLATDALEVFVAQAESVRHLALQVARAREMLSEVP